MTRYLLDTNTVSHLIKGHPLVARRLLAVPMASITISSITEGELRFGLAERPQATRLHAAVQEFLLCVDSLPWDSPAAQQYGTVRAGLERSGSMLSPMDLLIAAHAIAVDAVLVSNDQAFRQLTGLRLEDWSV